MTQPLRVRIVLPAYNEAQALESSLYQVHNFCRRYLEHYEWKILIVSNGCSDGTAAIASILSATYSCVATLILPNAGRGGALRRAAELPGADYLLYMDVDLSTNLEAMPRLLAELDRGADVVVGSRHHPHSQVTRALHREVLSRGYNIMLKTLFGVTTFKDAQCGFKAFRLNRLQQLLSLVRDHRWFFDTEVLVLAEYSGLKVVEVPVHWIEDLDSRVDIPTTIAQKLFGLARLKLTARRVVAHSLRQ